MLMLEHTITTSTTRLEEAAALARCTRPFSRRRPPGSRRPAPGVRTWTGASAATSTRSGSGGWARFDLRLPPCRASSTAICARWWTRSSSSNGTKLWVRTRARRRRRPSRCAAVSAWRAAPPRSKEPRTARCTPATWGATARTALL